MKSQIEKIKSVLEGNINLFSFQIAATIDNSRQYEKNIRYGYKLNRANDTLNYIKEWEFNIGDSVFKSLDRFTYSKEQSPDVLNKTEPNPVKFTEEMFFKLIKDIIEFKINYWTNELLGSGITSNSTHKLSNLEFEWILECKQENIKLHKELLQIIK